MKKPSMISVLLFLTGLLCIVALFFFNKSTLDRITTTEEEVDTISAQVTAKRDAAREAVAKYTDAIDTVQSNIDRMKQKQQTASQKKTKEKAEVTDQTESKPSVFSENSTASTSDSGTSVFSSGEETNGHIIGIDPGHQSESVDMSALEPNGPGSSEMKAKCSTGTQGTYSGVPEYQLNLEVSLQLRDELEQRGYQVVMTRTDNETAISNMERAQYVVEQGAEIYIRIHANGVDSASTSGALTMAPSQNNPYIPQLFEQSNRLSQCIIDSYCAATGFQNLGIQYYDNMTGINWSTVPVTILEMGFMTNQNDDLKMNDAEFQKTMVQGIANGIDSYFAS